ncbi:HAMP domain-containing protein [Dankookia sp. P2]|uniref:HAMP domain-containing protein n=1 Tax=Dankookia sp. P2 TaxID=3423955 RepID=UPI003D66BE80
MRQLEGFLLSAAGWVGGTALLLGLGGGLLIGRGVTRRAAAMATALARVEAGEIDHRLPVRRGGDEFDRLARRINATLDRVQGLMQALRQVTDDIAHDLRTPLGRLRQRLDAALRTAEGDAAWRATAEAAIRDTEQLLDVFAALLRIAQAESGARRAGFAESRPFRGGRGGGGGACPCGRGARPDADGGDRARLIEPRRQGFGNADGVQYPGQRGEAWTVRRSDRCPSCGATGRWCGADSGG